MKKLSLTLVTNRNHKRTVINVDNLKSDRDFVVIAGPCSVENEGQTIKTALQSPGVVGGMDGDRGRSALLQGSGKSIKVRGKWYEVGIKRCRDADLSRPQQAVASTP